VNEREYAQWRTDALEALLKLYSEEDSNKILRWFDRIKGSEELSLIGQTAFDGMIAFTGIGLDKKVWKLYNTMMARMFMYAPLILMEDE